MEELDVVFAKANEENISPVKMAQKMPKLEGAALERELARYFDDGSSAEGSQQDMEKSAPPATSSASDEKVEAPLSDTK